MPSRTFKFRGTRNHGRGKKAGRGAGKMGGRGNAGLHKHKAQAMLKYAPDHFGRHGFKRHVENETIACNIQDINQKISVLVKDGHAKETGQGAYEIDLGAAGFTKLLGSGTPCAKFTISVYTASRGAIEKINSNGGSIKMEKPPEEEKDKPKQTPQQPTQGQSQPQKAKSTSHVSKPQHDKPTGREKTESKPKDTQAATQTKGKGKG